MNDFDQAARYLAKRRPEGFFAWTLPGSAGRYRFAGWIDTNLPSFPGEPDRIPDTVGEFAPAGEGRDRWLVGVEFQSEPHSDMLERMGEYLYRLRREVRSGRGRSGKYAVLGVVINLTGAPQPAELDMTDPGLGGAGARLRLVVRTLREEEAGATLGEIAAGRADRCVLPWVPLLKGAEKAEIITEWRRLAEDDPDPHLRADYGAIALTFADLADRRPAWVTGLEGFNVKESQVLRQLMREVLEDATKESRQEGIREGRQEGLQMGELSRLREDVRLILSVRLPAPTPEDVERAIASAADVSVLTRWLQAAAMATSWEDFRSQLSGPSVNGV